MSDRVHCDLYLIGAFPLAKLDEIAELIVDVDGGGEVAVERHRSEILAHDPDKTGRTDKALWIEFEEMKFGGMPEELELGLRDAGISFAWEWGMDYDVVPGIKIWDAETNTQQIFSTVDGEIALQVGAWTQKESDEERLSLLKSVTEWQEWREKARCVLEGEAPTEREPEKPIEAKCDNCEWEGPQEKVNPIEESGLIDRLSLGYGGLGPFPVGECPRCDAFVYSVENLEVWKIAEKAIQAAKDTHK